MEKAGPFLPNMEKAGSRSNGDFGRIQGAAQSRHFETRVSGWNIAYPNIQILVDTAILAWLQFLIGLYTHKRHPLRHRQRREQETAQLSLTYRPASGANIPSEIPDLRELTLLLPLLFLFPPHPCINHVTRSQNTRFNAWNTRTNTSTLHFRRCTFYHLAVQRV